MAGNPSGPVQDCVMIDDKKEWQDKECRNKYPEYACEHTLISRPKL